MTQEQVAELLNLKVRTVQNWRHYRPPRGPHFVKVEGSIRYRPVDIEAYIRSNVQTTRD